VRFGEAPVGLAPADKDALILVRDSSRFGVSGVSANLAVIDVAAYGSLALAGYLESGLFPREMASTPAGSPAGGAAGVNSNR
jgi:hypothetical protein